MSPEEAMRHIRTLAKVGTEAEDAEAMRKIFAEILVLVKKATQAQK